jgi:hypothetical protein
MFRGRAEEIRGGSRRTGQDTQDGSRKSRHQRSRQRRHTADTASVNFCGGSITWACRERDKWRMPSLDLSMSVATCTEKRLETMESVMKGVMKQTNGRQKAKI